MVRYFTRMALLWSQLACVALATDRPAALPINSLVMAARPGVHFRVQALDKGEMHAGVYERVQRVRGEWLWLCQGWVQRRDVVPLWEAVEFFSAQINRRPTAFAYVSRAVALFHRGAYAAEIDTDLDKAFELSPDFAEAYYVRGCVFATCGDFERAIVAYDDALRLRPRMAEAYNDRGGVRYTQKETAAALKDFERAIQLCPSFALAHANRSSILFDKGELEAALLEANAAVRHDAGCASAHLALGKYWLAKSDDERALAAFSEAIRLDPKYFDARLQRGKALLRRGDYKSALVDLNKAAQLKPKDVSALEARGYAYYQLGAIQKSHADRLAAARMRRVLAHAHKETSIKDDDAWPSVAKQFAVDEKPAAAEKKQTGAADKNDAPVETPRGRTETLNATARRAATSTDERYRSGQRAVEAATEACELSEWKDADYIDTLAAAYAEAGDFEAAVKWQTKAIELGNFMASLKQTAQQRLDLYRAHRACREDAPGLLAREPDAETSTR